MDPVESNTLYLPYGNDYDGFTVLKSTDGGANWTSLGLLPGDAVNAFLIDPNTPTTFYAATDIGIFRSTDGGASFQTAGLANTPLASSRSTPCTPTSFMPRQQTTLIDTTLAAWIGRAV